MPCFTEDFGILHLETGQNEIALRLSLGGASLVAQVVKNLPAMWETWVHSLGWEDPWRREWQSSPVFLPEEFYGEDSLMGTVHGVT